MSLIKRGGVNREIEDPNTETQDSENEQLLDEQTSDTPSDTSDKQPVPPARPARRDTTRGIGGDSSTEKDVTRGGTTRNVGRNLPRLAPTRGGTTRSVNDQEADVSDDPSEPQPLRDPTQGVGSKQLDPSRLPRLAESNISHSGSHILDPDSIDALEETEDSLDTVQGHPGTGRTKGVLGSDRGTSTRQQGTSGRATRQRTTDAHILAKNTFLQNRYAVDDVLGIGGMSVVYVGRDTRFRDIERKVAIKEMYQRSPDSHTRALSLQFFEREANMLAALSHPSIPKIYDFFEENGRVYLVLELIPGSDLEDVLEQNPTGLSEMRVANWALQICDVLIYLHGHQPDPIVFRDMKPSNIVLREDDRIVLVDFGIARLLDRSNRKGTMIGTEGYASPEQFRGIAEPVSDIYALGATLHQMLTGSDPRDQTPFTFHERPLRMLKPDISPEMEAVVSRALEYEMSARWASAEELKQALMMVPVVAKNLAVDTSSSAARLNLLTSYDTSTELLWSFSCEDELRSSPIVHSGLVLIGCYDTNVYAIDATRGEFRWKYATEGEISSSPKIWQNFVIVGSDDGTLYGIDIQQGQARWKFRTDRPIRSSPFVEDRMIVVGSDDQHIYAVDGLRGTMLWKYRTWMPIRSSAWINEGSVYIGGNDNNVYCLDLRTGGLRWKQRTKGSVVSTPRYSEGLVFVGSSDNNLYALDSQGGWPAWRYRTGHSVSSSPFVLGQRVFVGSADGHLYALETKSGRLLWKYNTESQITSSPRVEGGRVYFGAVDGWIYSLDAGTGDLAWRYKTEGPVVSSPAVVDGVVYIGSFDSNVYALRA